MDGRQAAGWGGWGDVCLRGMRKEKKGDGMKEVFVVLIIFWGAVFAFAILAAILKDWVDGDFK